MQTFCEPLYFCKAAPAEVQATQALDVHIDL